jgi:hypothetical protein
MTTWNDWADGVLNGIGVPVNAINIDSLLHWSNAETAPNPLMRWNNPLNTTQKMLGSRDSGAQPGPDDVQIYPDVATGVEAACITLLNGNYPGIVQAFRASVPSHLWTPCCAELIRWGTGCAWLQAIPIPGDEDMFTDDDRRQLQQVWAAIFNPVPSRPASGLLDQIHQEIGATPDNPLSKQIADLAAKDTA